MLQIQTAFFVLRSIELHTVFWWQTLGQSSITQLKASDVVGSEQKSQVVSLTMAGVLWLKHSQILFFMCFFILLQPSLWWHLLLHPGWEQSSSVWFAKGGFPQCSQVCGDVGPGFGSTSQERMMVDWQCTEVE